MNTQTPPAGCDQQGRHETRQDRYAEAEWRDTVFVQRNVIKPVLKEEEPLTLRDLLMVVFVVAVLAGIASRGPWL